MKQGMKGETKTASDCRRTKAIRLYSTLLCYRKCIRRNTEHTLCIFPETRREVMEIIMITCSFSPSLRVSASPC